MTQAQRIIKYVAIAFAFLLIFSIVSGIIQCLSAFTNIFDTDDYVIEKLEELKITEDASVLDIEVNSANIILKKGETLKVETNNKDIEIKEKSNKLFITEKKHNWFGNKESSDLIIYVPDNFTFDGVAIESGAGKIEIEELSTKNLDLDLGAGKVTIESLTVLEETSIDGGAGKIEILSGALHDVELDMGVGELSLTSKITGDSEIDAGVGKINLKLLGTDYKIKVDKGIGSTTINGKSIEDNTYYGEGNNIINIDGGVGSIEISYGN